MSTRSRGIHAQRFFLGLAMLAATAFVPGCTIMREVMGFREQAAVAASKVRIHGTIETDGPVEGTLVVIVATPARDVEGGRASIGPNGEGLVGVDSYSRSNAGTFRFILDPGHYVLRAYEDLDRNGILDRGERITDLSASDAIDLAPGERAERVINFADAHVYEGEAVDLLGIDEKDVPEQRRFALWAFSAKGRVVQGFDEERFGPAKGRFGLWRPMDFLNEELAGIYFLEPYDEDRVPVLFVHGISGYPQQFDSLVGALDRSRYQPWFYVYPSGIGLAEIANHLARLMQKLRVDHDFDDLAIVAHSMGGLVARGAILESFEDGGPDFDIPLFVTINSPFGGFSRAANTESTRLVLPRSLHDMNPSSDYLTWLFYEDEGRTLPRSLQDETEHHVIIGYGGSGEPYNDGVVSIESQAHVETQERAVSLRVWNDSHTGVLDSKRTADRIKRLLDERF